MSAEPKVVVLIPAFNEAAAIESTVRGAAAYGQPLVVDDGSDDDTAGIAENAGAYVLRLATNCGYERALDAGFAEADRLAGDIVGTFDADGQYDASCLPAVVEPILQQRVDLVLGQRRRAARIGESVFNLYTCLRFGVRDILCGVKAYRLTLYRDHGRFDDGRSIGTELALAALRRGCAFETVKLPVRPRLSGRSRFGTGLAPNLRILRALRLAVCADIRRNDVKS